MLFSQNLSRCFIQMVNYFLPFTTFLGGLLCHGTLKYSIAMNPLGILFLYSILFILLGEPLVRKSYFVVNSLKFSLILIAGLYLTR